MFESSQKLDLIRHSLEMHRQQLPPESSVATDLKFEIDSTQSMSPGNMTFTNLVRLNDLKMHLKAGLFKKSSFYGENLTALLVGDKIKTLVINLTYTYRGL